MRLHILARSLILALSAVCVFLFPSVLYAQASSSSHYSTKEYFFGTGGEPSLISTHYSARTATGAEGVTNSSSTHFTGDSGTITPQDEYIEFVVNSSTVNLGNQTTTHTTQGTATFYVKAYVAQGYVVRNASPAPATTSHTLASPSSAVASAIGTEQFGINLTGANSCALCLPLTSFGAAPVQVPSGSYSFGAAASGYNTANSYKYVNGDIIAQSTKSSGETDYTISYILNISTITPAGSYKMNHIMVATGTY